MLPALIIVLGISGVAFAQSVDPELESVIKSAFEREGYDASDDELIRALALAAAENGVTSADFAPLPPEGASVLFEGSFTEASTGAGGVLDRDLVPAVIGFGALILFALLFMIWQKINTPQQFGY